MAKKDTKKVKTIEFKMPPKLIGMRTKFNFHAASLASIETLSVTNHPCIDKIVIYINQKCVKKTSPQEMEEFLRNRINSIVNKYYGKKGGNS